MHPRPGLRPAAAAAALLVLSACAAPQAAKQPWPAGAGGPGPRAFLWEVTRPDGAGKPLYLTGSVHVGRPGQFVFPPAFERVIGKADVLVLEIDPRAMESDAVQGLVFGLGTYRPPDGLAIRLDEKTRALLPAGLARNGLTPQAVAQLRPWVLAVTLGMMELQRAGYDPRGGIDGLLFARFQASREVRELETAEQQLRMLAGLPEQVQLLMLRDVLEGGETLGASLARIGAAWERGDAAAVEAATFERADDPELAALYEAIFFARNRAMAAQLAAFAGGPRVVLAAVGAGHVVGPKGVLALLEARGLVVRQLDPE
jgi:hypothetical protein